MFAGLAGGIATRAKSKFANIIPIKISVEGGLHKGSSQVCDAETLHIGDETSDTIMLLDPTISGDKVVIQNLPSVFVPYVAIETARGDVFANDRPVDQKILKRLPCRLKIAEVTLLLSKGHPSATNWHATGMMAAASLAIIAFSTERYLAAKDAMPLQMVQAEERTEPQTSATFELATSQLSSAGLDHLLTAHEGVDGSISISGNLPPSQMGTWNIVRQKIDQVTGGVPIQSNVIANADLPELPPFAAVSLKESPELILTGGERWFVGSAIGEGWSITEITEVHILVERGTEQVEVTF